MPMLGWRLELPDSDSEEPWANTIDESGIAYDIEIYDRHRLVYAAELLPEPQHTVRFGLEPCKSYRWTVRPAFRINNSIRYGQWMQVGPQAEIESKHPGAVGVSGRKASDAPAMLQDFASLAIKCGSR